MLRWIRGKIRTYNVRNQVTQEDAKVCQMSTLLRRQILNWYGHIKRREDDLSRKMIDMVVSGKRRRGGLDGDGLTTPGRI